jgi:UDP-N-acetyl-2-amino-2-deoxyglucuronate dehydrogenase
VTESHSVTIAFIGCGGIAQAHWRGIQTHAPQLRVTAVVDIDPARAAEMAEKTGGRAFTSLEAALDQGDFDAVDIMLPHNVHEQVAVMAFAAGKHVVLEKPMATTLDGCERILAAARKAGTVFMVAEQSQHWPSAVKAQQLIQDGAIGEIVTAKASFGGRAGSAWGRNVWRYDKQITGGGICIDGGLHWIRPLRMWLGEIEEVVAVLDYPLREMEGESLAHALFRFKSGKVAVYEALRAGAVDAPGQDFRVTGTEGIIVIEKGRGGRALLYDREHHQGCEIVAAGETHDSAFGLELADFTRAVLDGTPLAAGPEESLGDLRTVLAMYRSAQSRQWEKVWD